MNTPFDALPKGGNRIVYLRPVLVADLNDDMRAQIGDAEVVFSINGPDGQRLALVADRRVAVHLAQAHDCALVSLH